MDTFKKKREQKRLEITNSQDVKIQEIIADAMEVSSRTQNVIFNNRKDLTRSIVEGGVNISVMVLQVFRPSANPDAPSQSLMVLVGSTEGCTVKPECRTEDGILLEVQEAKDKQVNGNEPAVNAAVVGQQLQVRNPQQAAQSRGFNIPQAANTQGVQDPQHPKKQKLIRSFATDVVSVPKDIARGLCFGDIVRLLNLKARAFKGKHGDELVAINCDRCEKIPNITMADSLYALLNNTTNTRLTPVLSLWKEGDLKYTDPNIILKIQTPPDWVIDSFVPNSSIIETQYNAADPDAWVKKSKTNGPDEISLKTALTLQQWEGETYTKENKVVYHVEFNAYLEALRGFYIQNPTAWAMFAPAILGRSVMVAICKIQLNRTAQMPVNVAQRREMESKARGDYVPPQYPIEKDIDYGMNLLASGILFDASATYKEIGIPITAASARELTFNGPWPKIGLNERWHQNNMHSFYSSPPVICLVEYNKEQRDMEYLWTSKDVEFVAIVNCKIDDDIVEAISTMTPEEGDEYIKASMNPKVPSKNPKIAAMKKLETIISGHKIQRYPFAIFKTRVCKGTNSETKLFIEGTKDSDEDHTSQPPQQLLMYGGEDIPQATPDDDPELEESQGVAVDDLDESLTFTAPVHKSPEKKEKTRKHKAEGESAGHKTEKPKKKKKHSGSNE